MDALAILLSMAAFVVAAALSAVLSAFGIWLSRRARPDRISRKDLRWLAAQRELGDT